MKPLRRVLRLLFSRIPEQTRRFIKLHLLPSGLVPYVAAAIANETPKKRLSSRYSLVVSCYNVEPYIDEFFRSLLAQTVDLARLEIIAVDDGSTDGTAARIADWAERLPIRYVFQPNQGLAAARNTGLAYATGTWVSFPDPDDFLAKSYLEKVDREVARAHALPLSMISCKMVIFREAKGEKEDNHPLGYRFTAPRTILPASDLENHMQLSCAACWLRRKMIEVHELRFDPRVFPSFEDGHFVNRFLLLNPRTEVAFLKGPVYFYRKRLSADSTLDRSQMMPAWYLHNLRRGSLDILRRAKAATGEVPRFIQRTALYDIIWRLHELVDHPERAAIFTEEQQGEFFGLFEQLFAFIDCATINTFNLAHCHEEHKVGLLGLKRARRPVTRVYVRQYDAAKNLMQFSFFSADPENQIVARINERAVPLRYVSRRRAGILGRTFFFEHFFWVALDRHDYVSILVDTKICGLMRQTTELGNMATVAKLRQVLAPSPSSIELLPPALRNIGKATAGRDQALKFRGCWLFQDRHVKADDNAEHLYRYLLSIGKADHAFFVLAADSPDWKRLEAQGFKLIAFDSPEHQIALLVAKFLISSHADRFVYWQGAHGVPLSLTNYRFVFLQHGVTKDDVSRWMNSFSIHRFIASTEAEYRSIADPESDYRVSLKETALTGLCRHDRLLAIEPSGKSILIMPTWRKYFRKEPFSESEYFPRWRSLLRSPRLRQLARETALRIVFCPHPDMTPLMSAFDVPSHVEVRNVLTEESVQPLFAEAALLITDYSSVAFDLAYLDKPTIYYQFDAAEIFTGIHVYQRGYFDYARDGFGPVCETEDDVLANVQAALSGHEPPQYAERRRSTFRYRDGRCCERVYRSILALDAPLDAGDDVIALKSYTGVPNAGDAASRIIVSHFVAAPVRVVGKPAQKQPNLLGAGSILHWSDQHSVVWGTGFQSANQRLRSTPDKVFAVRGPLSRQRLLEAGCSCPALYGDPGILISQVFPKRVGSGGRLGVIPHYVDRQHPFLRAAKDHGAHIIDPGMPLPDYLSELAQCDCILSSSLHGIVFAHSFGIPATWVKLSSDVVGGAFKFQDYYMSIGYGPPDIPDLSGDDSIERAVRAAGTPREEIDREALRGALERAQQYIFDKRAHGLASMEQEDPIGPAKDVGQRKILVGVDNAERTNGAHALAQRLPQTNRRDTA